MRDRNHRAAIAYIEEQKDAASDALRLVFGDYVFDETAMAIVVRSRRPDLASAAGRAMLESKNLHREGRGTRLRGGLEAFRPTIEDKRWSFTDCTSFVLMENLGIRKAVTFDANFRQAGFATFP